MRIRTRATTRALPAILVAAALGLVAAPVARATVAPAHSPHQAAPAVATSTLAPATDTIVKHAFSPATMTVPVGTVVTWTNEDDAPHTVTTTKAPVAFDSGAFAKGKAFSYTFAKPGTYEYYCAVHPDMKAVVTVVPAAPAAPATKATAKPTKMPKAEITTATPTPPDKKPGTTEGGNSSSTPKDNMGSMSAPSQPDNGTATTPASSDDGWTPATDPVSGASDPFMKHLQAAHFNRSGAGQVHDIADFDTWMLSHEYLFRQMLDYEVGRQSTLGQAPGVGTFLQHMDVAHWNRSPAGQAKDIADLDTWLKSHEALFRMMFDPAVGKGSPAYSGPVTGPFMQHMDAAHWSRSPGQQLEDIGDFQNWAAAHAALLQAMLASGSGSGASAMPAGPMH
ncbi:MAG TPA: plastocyanin/azurin family copper-binding protein [Sporichthyaceae bacterium]|jgi:plastocyanin|nr:plastocyanin/azurin family copper-binding protein [Sporichthyaceae bacterium]